MTALGRQRAFDIPAHPQPFEPFIVEIGNEQGLDAVLLSDTIAIASAMIKRASALRLKVPLDFALGGPYGGGYTNLTRMIPFQKAIDALPNYEQTGVNSSWMFDFHIGGDVPEGREADFKLLAETRAALAAAGSTIKGAIFEENGNQHGMSRALAQARNANRAACMGDFLRIDVPASALQLFTRNDNGWDQGHGACTHPSLCT